MKIRITTRTRTPASGSGARLPGFGKANQGLLERAVYRNLGLKRDSVVVGPGRGFDNAVIRIDESRVMIVTTDPVSIIPALGMKESAWLSVHLIASDYVTSSRPPEFASFDFNLPQEMDEEDIEAYLTAVGGECRNLGISIVGGHTGTYPGAGFTVVGGGTIFGFSGQDEYLDPSMAQAGDTVMMTKGAAIETTATLANSFPSYVEERLGAEVAARAKRYTYSCSTVKDALTAASIGIREEGITSMHDATEGGVLGALCELSQSSNHAILVRANLIHVPEEARLLCSAFGIDPLLSLSEGTLLLTCRKERVDELRRKLRKNGIPVFEVGRIAERGKGLWLAGSDGGARRFRPGRDPFWGAYARALRDKLS